MVMMATTVAALSSNYPESNPAYKGGNIYKDKKERNKHIYTLLGAVPTIAANVYRHKLGLKLTTPKEDLPYVENFLFMLDK